MAINKMAPKEKLISTQRNKNLPPLKNFLMINYKILLMIVDRKKAILKKKREVNKRKLKMVAMMMKKKKMRGSQELL